MTGLLYTMYFTLHSGCSVLEWSHESTNFLNGAVAKYPICCYQEWRVSRVLTDHMLQQYIRVMFRLCSFLPTLRGQLDWHVLQRSQKQELLGTYAFSISTIAVSQFSGGKNSVNLPSRLRVRD